MLALAIAKGDNRVGVEFYFHSTKDIRFAVEFLPASGKVPGVPADRKLPNKGPVAKPSDRLTLMQLQKIHSHSIPQWHEYYAFEPGTFQFRLDNYNSYWSSKTVTYGVMQNKNLDFSVPPEFRLPPTEVLFPK